MPSFLSGHPGPEPSALVRRDEKLGSIKAGLAEPRATRCLSAECRMKTQGRQLSLQGPLAAKAGFYLRRVYQGDRYREGSLAIAPWWSYWTCMTMSFNGSTSLRAPNVRGVSWGSGQGLKPCVPLPGVQMYDGQLTDAAPGTAATIG